MPTISPKLKEFAEIPEMGEEMYRGSMIGAVTNGEGMFKRGMIKERGMEKSK